ncbi:MAG: hypothetical protein EBZ74_03180, partial [Planctomycetia bacterium]|nr:hypothetical protein [Planctomycetia bacterium]
MGGPMPKCVAEILRGATLCAVLIAAAPAAGGDAEPGSAPLTLRIAWGGGRPAARAGRIEIVDPGTPPAATDWRLLSVDPLAPATMHDAGGTIEVHEPRGLDMNGVDVCVADWRRARVRVRLSRGDSADEPAVVDVPVAGLVAAPLQQPLDGAGNRLSIGRAPGDELRVAFAAGQSAVRRPGETVGLVVHPLVPAATATAAAYELKVRVHRPGSTAETHAQTVAVDDAAAAAPGVREFRPLRLAVPLPPGEGACDVDLELVDRNSLRWARAVASRTIQLVAVSDSPAGRPAAAWQVAYELDPGSPKLLERLRRLPGMGMPSLPMAGVPLPKLPRPSFALPRMQLPTPSLPNVPLPSVPVPKLPSVAAMVPRLTGLLATGHSTLESHGLGPMLRLPPAAEGPAWEAIALPAGEPGRPHLVEIDYPLDQEMTLGLAVLEEADGEVGAVATSGVDLRAPLVDDGSRRGGIGTRRFVYWPRSRAPLLAIVNLAPRTPALFGRVRVLAGPDTVAAGPQPDASRRTYLHLPTPDFKAFGAAPAGHAPAAWDAWLGAVRRSADWVAAQGARGALVGVHAGGAALWPTRLAQYAPRWGAGTSFEGRLDAGPKDLLDLLCRVYARERVRLVPAVVCDGPLPALDALVAAGGPDADGLVALSRDGRPLVADGGRCPHYNVLDPRVQAAVEGLVAELAGRLRDAPAVDGVALLMPHDGWLHLPGVASGLDDATFARFVAAAGPDVEQLTRPALAAGEGRFAARAALVEGPLRDRWLAWREAAVAAFHARLADVVATARPAWSLHVMPTTLFVAGRFAERFRPHLFAEPRDADVLREAGLDPARITAHGRIVYVAPHVHAADAAARGLAHEANRSLSLLRGTAGAARVGAVLLEQPHGADVRDLVAHASFAAKPAGAVDVAVPAGGAESRRPLVESLLAGDPEAIFDAGLLHARVDVEDRRCRVALETLPPAPLDTVADAPAPLVVRVREGEAGLWVSVVNAGGAACRAEVVATPRPTAAVDAVGAAALPVGVEGEVSLALQAWEMRTIVLEGSELVALVRATHAPEVAREVAAALADLAARRTTLETPAALAALDNPSFELPELDGLVPGWELVEPGRGSLRLVPGKPSAGGRGLEFSSEHGLATLRSNPFPPPATGRVSVAVWVRA